MLNLLRGSDACDISAQLIYETIIAHFIFLTNHLNTLFKFRLSETSPETNENTFEMIAKIPRNRVSGPYFGIARVKVSINHSEFISLTVKYVRLY